MAKYAIACPECGKYAQASTSIFASKNILCDCGYTINVKTDKLSAKVCPHCKNEVLYDQSKGEKAVCPICAKPINTVSDVVNAVEFKCPQCYVKLSASKAADTITCPVCDCVVDVQKEYIKEKISSEGITSVIRYEGGNQTLVWKHPLEDFNYGSQLIVHETQEAILLKDGRALDSFGSGRHTLEVQNLPAFKEMYAASFGDRSVFHAEVYYVNLTTLMGIKWGTDSQVRFIEPSSGVYFGIGASGEFNIRVSDPRKLLLKVVGTTTELSRDALLSSGSGAESKGISGYFRGIIMTHVKSFLAQTIVEQQINILEIDARLQDLSVSLGNKINEKLEEYGLYVPEFNIIRVVTPENDPNFQKLLKLQADEKLNILAEEVRRKEAEAAQKRKQVEAETKAMEKILDAKGSAESYRLQAEAEAMEMKMKGYTYAEETSRHVGLEAMKNGLIGSGDGGGGSSMLGDIASLGVTLGAMGGIVNMTKDAVAPALSSMSPSTVEDKSPANGWNCPCGQTNISSKFCPECGKPEVKGWDCLCGCKNITSKFCPECGQAKPVNNAWTCTCGREGITSKFCPECGKTKPSDNSWTCSCGQEGITSKFCPECGKTKPSDNSWTCSCGQEGITSKFCPKCGKTSG